MTLYLLALSQNRPNAMYWQGSSRFNWRRKRARRLPRSVVAAIAVPSSATAIRLGMGLAWPCCASDRIGQYMQQLGGTLHGLEQVDRREDHDQFRAGCTHRHA